jgi:hypothetical protein
MFTISFANSVLVRAFIAQLQAQGYEYLSIKSEQDLISNLRAQLEISCQCQRGNRRKNTRHSRRFYQKLDLRQWRNKKYLSAQ